MFSQRSRIWISVLSGAILAIPRTYFYNSFFHQICLSLPPHNYRSAKKNERTSINGKNQARETWDVSCSTGRVRESRGQTRFQGFFYSWSLETEKNAARRAGGDEPGRRWLAGAQHDGVFLHRNTYSVNINMNTKAAPAAHDQVVSRPKFSAPPELSQSCVYIGCRNDRDQNWNWAGR